MNRQTVGAASVIAALAIAPLATSALASQATPREADGHVSTVTAHKPLVLHAAVPGGSTPIAEGPSYAANGDLYVVSVFGDRNHNKVFRIHGDPAVVQPVYADQESSFGATAIGPDGRLYLADVGLLTGRGRIVSMRTDGTDLRTVVDNVDGMPFFPDDLVFDRSGALLFNDMQGNITKPTGKILRRDPSGRITVVLDGLASPNGMAFSPDGKTLWVSEHTANRLLAVDLDDTGKLAESVLPDTSIVVAANLSGGEVDSLTVDSAGNVYAAMYKAGRVDVFDSHGSLLSVIRPSGGIAQWPNTSRVSIQPGTKNAYLFAGGPKGAELMEFRALATGQQP